MSTNFNFFKSERKEKNKSIGFLFLSLLFIFSISIISAVEVGITNDQSGIIGLDLIPTVTITGGEVINTTIINNASDVWLNDSTNTYLNTSHPQNVNFTGDLNIGSNLIFKLSETIDNLINGWLRITGNLNVTGSVDINNNLIVRDYIITDKIKPNNGQINITGNVSFSDGEEEVFINAEEGRMNIGNAGYEKEGINFDGTTFKTVLKLNDIGGNELAQFVIHRHKDTSAQGPAQVFARSKGENSTHVPVTNNNLIGVLIGAGWTGTEYNDFGRIEFKVNGSEINDTSSPSKIQFRTTQTGSDTSQVRVTMEENGNIIIEKNITIKGNYICNATACFNLQELNATGGGGGNGGISGLWLNDTSNTYINSSAPQNVNITGNLTVNNLKIFNNGSAIIYDAI